MPWRELSDYLAFIALVTIGLQVVRTQTQHPTPAPGPVEAVSTAN